MNGFNNAQVRLVIKAALRHLGDIAAIRLDEYFAETPALVGVYVDLIERILTAVSQKAKEELVASFLDRDGKPYGVTLAQVEEAMAKGRVPATYVIENRRLVKIAPFAALQNLDQLAGFRAEMERRGRIADKAPEAAADAPVANVG